MWAAMESLDFANGGISIVIPALNEEATIAAVVRELRDRLGALMRECIVVDNGSADRTREAAEGAGVRVVSELRRGYGSACAAGAAQANPESTVLVFMDGDGSDMPADIPAIAGPVLAGQYDFVIGSRIRGQREPGSLLLSQVFAGWLSGTAMRLLYGVRFTDMGPPARNFTPSSHKARYDRDDLWLEPGNADEGSKAWAADPGDSGWLPLPPRRLFEDRGILPGFHQSSFADSRGDV